MSGSKADIECGVKLAGHETNDRLYEPKRNRKLIRAVTVLVYVLSVSLAGIILSLYYVFFWNPSSQHTVPNNQPANCIGIGDEGSRETPKVLPQMEDTTPSMLAAVIEDDEAASSEIPASYLVPD